MIICKKCKSTQVQHKEWVNINTGEPKGHCDEGESDKEFYYCERCEEHCFLADADEGFKIDLLSPDGFSMYNGKLYDDAEDAEEDFHNWKKRFNGQGYYSSNKGQIPIEDLLEHMIFKLIKIKEWVGQV